MTLLAIYLTLGLLTAGIMALGLHRLGKLRGQALLVTCLCVPLWPLALLETVLIDLNVGWYVRFVRRLNKNLD